jgi:hypothetical protein
MAYTSTSVEEILGRIVRNNNNKLPAHYVDSMLEWIPEAVELMRTTHTLNFQSTPNKGCDGEYITENHAIRLPCGLVELLSVENEYGERIHRSGSQLDTTNLSVGRSTVPGNPARVTDFITSTDGIGTGSEEGPSVPWTGSNIVPIQSPVTTAYYDLQLDWLLTSEESMFIKLNYKSLPVDERGYPLIPNVPEFKEAIYWYVMHQLIGAGFQHPLIPSSLQGLEYCTKEFEKWAGRALGEIKMPDQDRMGKLFNATTRLIPPVHFYQDFFQGAEQMQPIRGI